MLNLNFIKKLSNIIKQSMARIKARWSVLKIKLQLKVDNELAKFSFITQGTKRRYMANPLLKYPRNVDCHCGSGHKFKTCCYHRTQKTVPIELGLELLKFVDYIERATGK